MSGTDGRTRLGRGRGPTRPHRQPAGFGQNSPNPAASRPRVKAGYEPAGKQRAAAVSPVNTGWE